MLTDPNAELTSLSSQIDALLARIAELIAAAKADRSGKDSRGLREAERHLQGARRELVRVEVESILGYAQRDWSKGASAH